MEEEERAAQSAKLQELIRRGGPEDLQEANRLMKVMAGYDTKNKTDYRAKAAEEVGKIQQKARILEEMLETFQKGDKITEGDVFEVCGPHLDFRNCCSRSRRNLRMLFRAPNRRFRKCVRRNQMTMKQLPSYSRSTIASTVRLKGIS